MLWSEDRELNVLITCNSATYTAEKVWRWESGGCGASSSHVTMQLLLKLIRSVLK